MSLSAHNFDKRDGDRGRTGFSDPQLFHWYRWSDRLPCVSAIDYRNVMWQPCFMTLVLGCDTLFNDPGIVLWVWHPVSWPWYWVVTPCLMTLVLCCECDTLFNDPGIVLWVWRPVSWPWYWVVTPCLMTRSIVLSLLWLPVSWPGVLCCDTLFHDPEYCVVTPCFITRGFVLWHPV